MGCTESTERTQPRENELFTALTPRGSNAGTPMSGRTSPVQRDHRASGRRSSRRATPGNSQRRLSTPTAREPEAHLVTRLPSRLASGTNTEQPPPERMFSTLESSSNINYKSAAIYFVPNDPSDVLVEEMTCSVCLELYTDPRVIKPCGHIFCLTCLQTLVICPECREPITGRRVINRKLQNLLDSIKGKCTACDWTGTFETFLDNHSKDHPAPTATEEDILSQVSSKPPSAVPLRNRDHLTLTRTTSNLTEEDSATSQVDFDEESSY